MWRCRPSVLRSAVWAFLSLVRVRSQLRHGSPRPLRPPRRVSARGSRGVAAALHRLSPTCLERALVVQSWHAGAGDERDVVIGVPAAGFSPGVTAHAWLEGASDNDSAEYVEIHRVRSYGRGGFTSDVAS